MRELSADWRFCRVRGTGENEIKIKIKSKSKSKIRIKRRGVTLLSAGDSTH